MQIVFFSRNKDLLEALAPLSKEMLFVWFGENLPPFSATSPSEGLIFFDYDDPGFDLSAFLNILDKNSPPLNHFLKVLFSSEMTTKTFKKLKDENKFIDSFLRAPIKLKDIETFVEDYKLVLKEPREAMSGLKKKETENPTNSKIQQKFDLIFDPNQKKDTDTSLKFVRNEIQAEEDKALSDVTQKTVVVTKSSPKVELSFEDTQTGLKFNKGEAGTSVSRPETPIKLASAQTENDLEFSLDFDEDIPEIPDMVKAEPVSSSATSSTTGGLELPKLEDTETESNLDAMFDAAILDSKNEETQKTILFNPHKMKAEETFQLETINADLSDDLMMTPEETKSNIGTTIKQILTPDKRDITQETINIKAVNLEQFTGFSADDDDFGNDLETTVTETDDQDKTKDLGTPSIAFNLKNVPQKTEVLDDFDLSTVGSENEGFIDPAGRSTSSLVNNEDSIRIQATIRQLREEREELFKSIKMLKTDNRDLEQDNLTLKAALDETKIEVSLLRKRHMVEMEDIKYQLSLLEEKKHQALEKARQEEIKREKLEQRVRIDFNQVKQREKELESKLEMLSVDVDLQVHSRDQKILELRRKIDSLEFNMENVSIKEQKSENDKRKLEDKLNKIMKTLRHSIKNIEDDIEQVVDEELDERPNRGFRSGKI